MEVLELKAVQEDDGGPKPRRRGGEETRRSERANSTEPRSCRGGRRVTSPRVAASSLLVGVRQPTTLCPAHDREEHPAEENPLLFLASERRWCMK